MGDNKFRQSGGLRRTRRGPYRADERARRRQEGEERNARWRALTTTQKIAVLTTRPGACKRQFRDLAGGR